MDLSVLLQWNLHPTWKRETLHAASSRVRTAYSILILHNLLRQMNSPKILLCQIFEYLRSMSVIVSCLFLRGVAERQAFGFPSLIDTQWANSSDTSTWKTMELEFMKHGELIPAEWIITTNLSIPAWKPPFRQTNRRGYARIPPVSTTTCWNVLSVSIS